MIHEIENINQDMDLTIASKDSKNGAGREEINAIRCENYILFMYTLHQIQIETPGEHTNLVSTPITVKSI